MKTLKHLGMNAGWIYEVVLSTYSNDVPHAAPFGVNPIDSKHVKLSIYKGSHTLENILNHRQFTINVVEEMDIFYNALYARDKLEYTPAQNIDAPVLKEAAAHIEVTLTSTVSKPLQVVIEGEVEHVQISDPCIPINRAKNLLLESLIVSTRISHLPGQGHFLAIARITPSTGSSVSRVSDSASAQSMRASAT